MEKGFGQPIADGGFTKLFATRLQRNHPQLYSFCLAANMFDYATRSTFTIGPPLKFDVLFALEM